MSELDDNLVAATDALLNGQELPPLLSENQGLGIVLIQLHELIASGVVSGEFNQRLAHRLDMEWERYHSRPALRLLERPLVRLVAVAAAVVIVLGAALVLTIPSGAQNSHLPGMAIGVNQAVALLVLLAVAGIGAFTFWRSRR